MLGQAPKLSLEFITGKSEKHLAVEEHNKRFPDNPLLISGKDGALKRLPPVAKLVCDTPELRAEQEKSRKAAAEKKERKQELNRQWQEVKNQYPGFK